MSSILIKISITSFVLISVLSQNGLAESRKVRIKLKNIEVLTLNSGKWTTGRRTSPVPQLQCAGGYCNQFKPQTVQCYNRGSDGVDIQWECKTEMPQKYKFGQIDVICEGYDYPEDDYVLVGSCTTLTTLICLLLYHSLICFCSFHRKVDESILNIARRRFYNCVYYERGVNEYYNRETLCAKEKKDMEEAHLNFFIKYGDLSPFSNVIDAFMKQKHRLIWERRQAEKELGNNN